MTAAKDVKVLVVDDNVASAKTLGWMVEMIGHEFSLAHDGLEALEAAKTLRPDVILLDNMTPEHIRLAVGMIAKRATIEVSGGVRLETVRDYALPGVAVISIGALTHSAPSADIGLDFAR